MNEFKTTAPVYKNLGIDLLPQPYEDAVSEQVKYFGWAPLGVGEDEEGWLIMRETVSGTQTKREYANGSMNFDCKWSERTTYSYRR